jgi:hypothetical protein
VTFAVLVATSLLTVLLAVAFARERRLRIALQRLLAKLLSFWRTRDANAIYESDDGSRQSAAGDRVQ